MHNFGYVGQGNYICRNCGGKATKSNHATKIKETCPNAPTELALQHTVNTLTGQLSALTESLELILQSIEDIDIRVKTMEGITG